MKNSEVVDNQMERILNIILKQYFQIYAGAVLMSIYYKLRGKNIGFKDIIRVDEDNRNPLRYIAFYWGMIFWMMVAMTGVWLINQ